MKAGSKSRTRTISADHFYLNNAEHMSIIITAEVLRVREAPTGGCDSGRSGRGTTGRGGGAPRGSIWSVCPWKTSLTEERRRATHTLFDRRDSFGRRSIASARCCAVAGC